MKNIADELDQPASYGLSPRNQILALAGLAVAILLVVAGFLIFNTASGQPRPPSYIPGDASRFVPTADQMAALKIETVQSQLFRTEIITDGYVAPNGGLVAAGGMAGSIAHGAPVLPGQSSDVLQAQSDQATAAAQVRVAAANEKRQHELYLADGAALKDWQQSQLDLATAGAALASAQSRLRMLGHAPSAANAVFAVGDASQVWLIANVREADAASVHQGDAVAVRIPAFPNQVFQAKVDYVAAMIDPTTHRLVVGAEVRNTGGQLKPNMQATVTILAGPGKISPYLTQDAIIYEGDAARVWVAGADGTLTMRPITIGRVNGDRLEITKGLNAGERVVTGGGLFIDRAAQSN